MPRAFTLPLHPSTTADATEGLQDDQVALPGPLACALAHASVALAVAAALTLTLWPGLSSSRTAPLRREAAGPALAISAAIALPFAAAGPLSRQQQDPAESAPQALVAEPPSSGRTNAAVPPPSAPPAGPAIHRDAAGRYGIHAQQQSRLALARELAALSGAQLLGDGQGLGQAAPVTLTLEQASEAQAWAAVLGDAVSHALHCGAGGCRVWLTPGPLRPDQAPKAVVLPDVARAASPAATPSPAAVAEAPPQADPPGLFPAQ